MEDEANLRRVPFETGPRQQQQQPAIPRDKRAAIDMPRQSTSPYSFASSASTPRTPLATEIQFSLSLSISHYL